jgi:hypothetical protein
VYIVLRIGDCVETIPSPFLIFPQGEVNLELDLMDGWLLRVLPQAQISLVLCIQPYFGPSGHSTEI